MKTREQQVEATILNYFESYDAKLGDKFSSEEMLKVHNYLDLNGLEIMLCNLEDVEVMEDISNGIYDSFDPYNEDQFNDGYCDYAEELGFIDNNDDW